MSDNRDENRGVLFPNDRKTNDKQPDFRGKGNFGGQSFEIAAWKKPGRNGTFLSISFKEPYQREGDTDRAQEPADDFEF